MARPIPERRRLPRVPRTIPLHLGHGTEELVAASIDLSASGVYCQVSTHLPVMTKVQVTFVLPGEGQGPQPRRITCTGVVVRVESVEPGEHGPSYRLAIFFTELTPTDQDALATFVREPAA